MRSALALAIALAAIVAFPAQSADRAKQRQIVDLLNQAITQVYKAAPHCRPENPFERKTTLTDADPSADLLNTFAIFRRPATAEELSALTNDTEHLPAQGVYRRYARIATSASGRRFLVFAAQNVDFYKPRPQRCIAALRRDYAKLVAPRPKAFKRSARHGMFGSGAVNNDRPVVSGLLPDGVASVTVRFGAKGNPNPFGRRRHYKPLTRTVAVRDNVVAFGVNRAVYDSLPESVTWYAADGTLLRVVDFP